MFSTKEYSLTREQHACKDLNVCYNDSDNWTSQYPKAFQPQLCTWPTAQEGKQVKYAFYLDQLSFCFQDTAEEFGITEVLQILLLIYVI